jgi:hypothetical protein
MLDLDAATPEEMRTALRGLADALSPSLLARVGPLLVSLALLAAILMIFAAWVAALVLVARLACGAL